MRSLWKRVAARSRTWSLGRLAAAAQLGWIGRAIRQSVATDRLEAARAPTHVLADVGDQRRFVLWIDVGDVVEAERRELGIRAMVVRAQRGFEAIERAMQIAQRLPPRSTRIDALRPAIAILASIPSVAPTVVWIVWIVSIVRVVIARIQPTARRSAATLPEIIRLAPTCPRAHLVFASRPPRTRTFPARGVCRAHELPQRLTQVSLVRRVLEERVGTKVEHVGEVAQRSAEPTVENHWDRRAGPSATQPREQHVGVEIGHAREDRSARSAARWL
jgi:hypothetical protein